MNSFPHIGSDAGGELEALTSQLSGMLERIQELTGDEVDAVLDPSGSAFLLYHAQQRLRESERVEREYAAQRAAILNALPAHIALLDPEGIIVTTNEAWNHFASSNDLGDANFCVGQNYVSICAAAQGVCAEEASAAAAGITSVLKNEAPEFVLEYPCHSPAEKRWFRLMVSPLDSTQRRGAVVMHVNITERRLREEALRESEQRYRELFHNNPLPMWVYDMETLRFLAVNDAAVDHYGYSREQFLSMTIADIRPEEDVPALQKSVDEAEDGISHAGIWRHRLADGRLILVDITSHTLQWAGRRAEMVLALDMTERIETEEKLRESEAFFQMATKITRMGPWSVEIPRNAITWSDVVCDIHEVSHGYAPGIEEALSFYAPEHRGLISEAFNRCVDAGTPFDLELEILTRTGRRVWVRALGEAVRDLYGEIFRVQGALQDIDRSKLAEHRQHELEERLFRTLETISDAFFTLDEEWRFVYLNHEAERLTRRSRAELAGKVIWEEFPESAGSVFQDEYTKAAESGETREFEAYYAPLEMWLRVRVFPLEDSLAVYFSDITEKRNSLALVAASEERFRELAEHIRDVFYVTDPHAGKLLYVSPAYEAIWGRSCESLYKDPKSYQEAVHPEDRQVVEASFQEHLRGTATDVEYRIILPGGEVRWISDETYPVLGASGKVERVVGTARDITERKLVEEGLRTSEERFRLLSKATNDAIWDWNLSDDTLWWNEGFETLFGYTRSEIEPTIASWTSRIHPDDRDEIVGQVKAAIRSGVNFWSAEYRYRRKDGTYAYVLDRGNVIRNEEGVAIRMVGGMTDLSEQKVAESKLRQQAALLDAASDAIFVRDLHHRILYWNRRAEELYGYPAAQTLGKSAADLLYVDPSTLPVGTAAVLQTGEWSGELQIKTASGGILSVLARWTLLRDAKGEPQSILAINTDITERKRLEEQFLRTQRMESIGTLASGIAHDLNNILSPILMSIELLREQAVSPDALSLVETLHTGAERGADLVRQILGFARGVERRRGIVRPAQILQDLERIVRDTFPRNIVLQVDIPNDVWSLEGDATQIHQILMNLCVNARDAMPQGGMLSLSIRNRLVDEVFAGMNAESKPGPYVVFQVEDMGQGISPEIQERIFEPFFTTKDPGQGTGLGLSTVFSIIRGHSGFFNVYSEPGKGTKFKVYLPALLAEDDVEDQVTVQPKLPRGKGELVLLVDDEDNIRKVTSKALEHFGYRVMLASNGAEALALFVRHQKEVGVVLTDMSMPVMDGPAMAVALRTIDPDVRIIGSSGLNANDQVAKAIGAGVEHFVPKPYSAEVLLTKLRAVIEESSTKRQQTVAEEGGTIQQMQHVPQENQPSIPEVEEGSDSNRPRVVLVVDDEETIGDLARRILLRTGYEVLYAGDGEQALAALEAREGHVDVVMTDLHMPRMNGIELFETATRSYSHLRFVFVTGDGQMQPGLQDAQGRTPLLLNKPYTAALLREAITNALAQ